MTYGEHASLVKEKCFTWIDLADKMLSVQVTIFPLEDVQYLQGLWISPMTEIPQTGINPRLAYNFSQNVLHKIFNQTSPKEAIYFVLALH